MDHVAVMSRSFGDRGSSKNSGKKSWGFIDKILSREKTIESRWYQTKRPPWDVIHTRDTIYFKNAGQDILAKAQVEKVIQVSELTPKKVKEILRTYGKQIGIHTPFFAPLRKELLARKKYCILIFLKNPKKVAPFSINKKGFGAMASWVSVSNIHQIQK